MDILVNSKWSNDEEINVSEIVQSEPVKKVKAKRINKKVKIVPVLDYSSDLEIELQKEPIYSEPTYKEFKDKHIEDRFREKVINPINKRLFEFEELSEKKPETNTYKQIGLFVTGALILSFLL